MEETKQYIQHLFKTRNIDILPNKQTLFDSFVCTAELAEIVSIIQEKQDEIMKNWQLKNRIDEIINQKIVIPNANINKEYKTKIDFEKLNLADLNFKEFVNLEEIGLSFDKENNMIEGIPTKSGVLDLKLQFKIEGESENRPANEKSILLIVNPDPKSLWKEIPSDKNALYWKKDDVVTAGKLGDKNIIVASKRGRSHENVGSFRDDDFAYKYFENGWSVIAVSDGAGSYSLSRKGSELACELVIKYFEDNFDIEAFKELEDKLGERQHNKEEILLKEIEIGAKQHMYKATVYVHNQIKEFAESEFKAKPELFNNPTAKSYLDYYHATLIFTLFKKYEYGYAVLTFGVGDCPIALMNKEQTETELLNWLDVGEFGGGTRFITQPSIFHSTEHPMVSRFNFKLVPDFSYFFLMTDGIYDPKFGVEANLANHEKWIAFLEDLKGENEDNKGVNFHDPNVDIATQLSEWMDFWSQGNHDDRTLAIIY